MEGSNNQYYEFPGFQNTTPIYDIMPNKRTLSRLQRQAPAPLPLGKNEPTIFLDQCKKGAIISTGCNVDVSSSLSSSSSSSCASFFCSKDPIPLLTPLALPSMLETPTIAESH
ncbi:hypothetical protein LIER_22003 [Lithospermum erythrorhizon]|uniref:Uncharacterized protein n=1 Tax=Lithospermum erythrorhizon TaxID=34254 RepID=A0AAV3QV85_LITER